MFALSIMSDRAFVPATLSVKLTVKSAASVSNADRRADRIAPRSDLEEPAADVAWHLEEQVARHRLASIEIPALARVREQSFHAERRPS